MSNVWVSMDHYDEPLDQQTDFDGPYWGVVGPDAGEGGWSFTVFNFDEDNAEVVGGNVTGEDAAKSLCELHGRSLSMIWNVRQLSDDDLIMEIHFARGFGPNRAGTPEDRWEALLLRELDVRQAT